VNIMSKRNCFIALALDKILKKSTGKPGDMKTSKIKPIRFRRRSGNRFSVLNLRMLCSPRKTG